MHGEATSPQHRRGAIPLRANDTIDVTIESLLEQLNWIDWGVLTVLLIFAAGGIGRGFLIGVLDIAGLVVAAGIAQLSYLQVAAAVPAVPVVPAPLADATVFLVLFLVLAVVISIVIAILRRVVNPFISFLGPVAVLERGLGILPGLAKGALFAALLLVPFAIFPILPNVTDAVERSSIGSRLTYLAIDTAPKLGIAIDRNLSTDLVTLDPASANETITLQLGPLGTLTPDPIAEEQMLELINRERAAAGAGPLKLDERLRDVARQHSREMFELDYFSHSSPVSGSPADRLRAAQVPAVTMGENLAYAPNVQIAHEGLMNSPSHRANILQPEFTRLGIGVIRSERQGRMFSQEFAG